MAKNKKAGWQEIYEVVGIVPGEIVHGIMGRIDLSDPDTSLELIEKLELEGCPFIQKKVV